MTEERREKGASRFTGGLVRRRVRRNFSEGGSLGEGGFNLIELMTVLAIIMILAGLIVGGAKYAMTKAGRSRAEAEIAAMENALENYKNDYGVYPPSTTTRFQVAAGPAGLAEINNSVALYAALAGGTKVYMTFKPNQIHLDAANKPYIVDPFGSPYNYYCTQPVAANQQNQATFDLWSYGPDGMQGTSGTVNYDIDNITNWKQ
jgi:type II secretory pathway pseudopilin PulG